MFKRIFAEHISFWNAERRRSLYVGITIFFLAGFLQVSTGKYAAKSVTNFVGDLLLDNLPLIHLDFLIVGGAVIFAFITAAILLLRPHDLLFGMKAIALLVAARAFFISLTHLGIYPEQIIIDQRDFLFGIYKFFDFEGNFFFSGHTGLPFLLALIYWRERPFRYAYLAISVLFGIGVLLAHVHYSIDVFAAPFIAYGVFKIAQKLFPRDYALLVDGR